MTELVSGIGIVVLGVAVLVYLRYAAARRQQLQPVRVERRGDKIRRLD